MKNIFNFKNALFCRVFTEDLSGKTKEYYSFAVDKKNADKHLFVSTDGKCVLYVNADKSSGFAETSRVKKCVLRFKFKDKGAEFAVHNESVTDFAESGLREYPEKGKSTYFLCVKNGDEYLNFANVLPCKFLSYFKYEKKRGYYYVDFITEYPADFKGKFRSETVVFSDEESVSALKKFAATNEKEFEKPIGWSTWDYYFTDINEQCVKENVDFIAADKILSKKVRYIAIDDGWEQSEGFWREGATFPSGLESVAEYIKGKGFKAGIWTCPVRINTLCPTVMRRNAFLLKDEYGDPIIYDGYYVLDPTHPDGEKFIRETFSYLRLYGFEFYKIDFIGHILAGERFYDKTAGHYDAIRRLLEIIRETVGNSHIMGCNMPYGVGYGYVDSRRVGLDIHNTYGHIVKCSEIFLPQFAAHDKIYHNDLDYLVVRGEETSYKDEYNVLNPTKGFWKMHKPQGFVWRCGNDFTYNEAKIWCALQLVSGSSLFLGDRLSKLNGAGLDLIYKTMENADFISGEPDGIFEKPLPSVWKKENAVAVFNFTDSEKTFCITALKDKKYKDVFSERVLSPNSGNAVIKLEPHDCVYMVVKNV